MGTAHVGTTDADLGYTLIGDSNAIPAPHTPDTSAWVVLDFDKGTDDHPRPVWPRHSPLWRRVLALMHRR